MKTVDFHSALSGLRTQTSALKICLAVTAAATALIACGAAAAQEYPYKPMRVIAPEAGGGADFAARLIGQALTASLGQQVIVDNRGAASGIIAAQTVARAAPDGYTLLFYGSAIWLLPFLREHVPFDPVKDFQPVTVALTAPSILVVHPALAANSVKELIALAKAKPGALNYVSGASGGSPHLSAELFKTMAGVNIVRVNFKGTAMAINALLAGEVPIMFPTAGSIATHLKSGRLRALAVTSAQPSALVPDLPTVAASLPGYESGQSYAMFAPAKTPAAIINKLNHEIVRILRTAEMSEKFLKAGVEVVASSPQQMAAALKSEMTRMGKVIKDAGIREE